MEKKWVELAGLVGIATISQAVRFCISYIAAGSDLLHDTQTSNTEYGLATGPGFLLIYAIVTIPIGRLVDKLSKLKWFIISASLAIAIATALNSLATLFWTLLYPRCLLAIFSAGIDPASLKLLSVSFPAHMRGIAFGFYLAAVYIGSALASLTLLLSSIIGWRLTFLLCGLIGILFTVIGAFLISNEKMPVKEPLAEIQDEVSQKSDWKQLTKNKTLILTLLATFFRYAAGFSRGYFEALYFSAQFSDSKTIYSLINALALLITPVNLALAGKFSDTQEANSKPKYRPLLCGITNLISVPFIITMYLTTNFGLAMFCLVFVYAFGETYISISITMMVNVTLPRLRGLQTASLMCISFIGGTLSTVSLGVLNTSHSSLQISLLVFVVIGYLIAGLLFLVTVVHYPKDLKRYEEETISAISL